MSIALLFPGQGSQHPGMLRDLPDTPAAARARSEAADTLGSFDDVPDRLDTADALRSTTNTQLALLVAGAVTARALIDDHRLPVATVAGHSVGAFPAAVAAGVLGLADALRAVRTRGRRMERACADAAWGMAALRGLGAAAARRLLDSVATESDPVWIANINAADQIVVSGTRTALDRLREQAPAAGATDMTVLDVSVASHCPLQDPTADAVAAVLARVGVGAQERAYLANTTGRRILRDPAKVIADLAQAVRQPVRWYDAARLMPELGVTATVHVPPGHVLTALVSRENPDATHVAIDDIGLAAAVRRAERGERRASDQPGRQP
ncbi:acyltransferase domain-containing protein [Streptomyces sp. NPDC046985]|uniref:ACP S-malonyltransferase n=1 Tax=Streptomyces sp. NPDC046985 TaxID=3155377 RepID=UPI00340C256E